MKQYYPAMIIATAMMLLTGCGNKEAFSEYTTTVSRYNAGIEDYNNVIMEFNSKASLVNESNAKLAKTIMETEYVVQKGGPAYDESVRNEAEAVINKYKFGQLKEIVLLKEKEPMDVDDEVSNAKKKDILALVDNIDNELNMISNEKDSISNDIETLVINDHSTEIDEILKAKADLIHSCSIQRQITDPDPEFIISRMSKVENIANMAPTTLDNDPNDGMRSERGYKVQIYFSTPLLPGMENLKGDALIDEGTTAGGSIEIYRSIHDAKQRYWYLLSLDGTKEFDPGRQYLLGSCIIRLAEKINEEEAKRLSQSIKGSFLAPGDDYDKIVDTALEKSTLVNFAPISGEYKYSIPESFDNVCENFDQTAFTAYMGDLEGLSEEKDYCVLHTQCQDWRESTSKETISKAFSIPKWRDSYYDSMLSSFVFENYEKVEETDVLFLGEKCKRWRGVGKYKGKEVEFCFSEMYVEEEEQLVVCLIMYHYGRVSENSYPEVFDRILASAVHKNGASLSRKTGNNSSDGEANTNDLATANAVTPSFKKTMDEYEVFFDDYVRFMKKYTSSNDILGMYSDYISMLDKYTTVMDAMESIDEIKLSDADYEYYIEVTGRINQKLMMASF
ncbi:MAG: hypothetical protein K6F53_07070 [Lachnospiraceae bacterium]|nr:hypothetical protein [Lachnospiraceae bacterium]